MNIILGAVLFIFLSVNFSGASNVIYLGESEDGFSGTSTFRLDGLIENGDADRFSALFMSSDVPNYIMHRLQIELNSPGGSYIEGLKLAEQFKRLGIATLVKAGDSCYSACALAFLGGSDRLKDPTMQADQAPKKPNRSLEKTAILGFHAPYLNVKNSNYEISNVEEAYRLAVDSISLLIEMADDLQINASELPKLLRPGRDAFFYADTVDAIRTLSIDYKDYSPFMKDLPGITRSMVQNACINRWYHSSKSSAYQGYKTADITRNEFEEGSELLENGEVGYSFGIKRFKNENHSGWIAFTPIKLSDDGKNYLWCMFNGTPYYRTAGSVKELFEPLNQSNDLWKFLNDSETVNIEMHHNFDFHSMRVMDMVPADTNVKDVGTVISQLLVDEEIIK